MSLNKTIIALTICVSFLDLAKAQDLKLINQYHRAFSYIQEKVSEKEYYNFIAFCRYTVVFEGASQSQYDSIGAILWPREIAIAKQIKNLSNADYVAYDYLLKQYGMTPEQAMKNSNLEKMVADSLQKIWEMNAKVVNGSSELLSLASKRETGLILFFSLFHSNMLSASLVKVCGNYSDSYSELPSLKFLFFFDDDGEIQSVYEAKVSP